MSQSRKKKLRDEKIIRSMTEIYLITSHEKNKFVGLKCYFPFYLSTCSWKLSHVLPGIVIQRKASFM